VLLVVIVMTVPHVVSTVMIVPPVVLGAMIVSPKDHVATMIVLHVVLIVMIVHRAATVMTDHRVVVSTVMIVHRVVALIVTSVQRVVVSIATIGVRVLLEPQHKNGPKKLNGVPVGVVPLARCQILPSVHAKNG
jgi:hypothetical protein